MKLDKICRTCLLEKANLRNLFEACVANMLMSCASIQVINLYYIFQINVYGFQVMEGDGLPDQICIQCLQNVNKAYSFKQLCEESDLTLRNYLLTLQTDMINNVKTDLFSTSEVLQQSSLFQDIFNDATTHSLVETFTNQNTGTGVT